MSELGADLAERFARIALGHVGREYPHKLDHVMNGAEDVLSPRRLHPAFYGSFDWHSCVHSWWMLLTLLRKFPDIAAAGEIVERADATLNEDNIAGELAYLEREYSGGFERPYGWAWLLTLHAEAARHEEREWGAALEPLAREFAARFELYLPRLGYPIRTGTHYNSAFAMVLAHGWAKAFDPKLAELIVGRARDFYADDRDCQAWEPAGDEFLSPALIEALAMATVLEPDEFRGWFAAFLPRLNEGEPKSLFVPAIPSDRSDGKIVHLDGFNLARAWCWRRIAGLVEGETAGRASDAVETHLAASLPHVAGDYMGEHWLASFAVLALEG